MESSLEQLKYPVGHYQKPEKFDPALLSEWLGVLKALPSWMDTSIENLDEAQLHIPYREGGWSIQQLVHHLADSHMNAFIRIKLALTEDNPIVSPYNETAWAELADTKEVPLNISVTLLHGIHRRWLALLQHMKPEDWLRTYYHPEHQRNFTIWEVVGLYAWHSKHHFAQIMGLRKKMNLY